MACLIRVNYSKILLHDTYQSHPHFSRWSVELPGRVGSIKLLHHSILVDIKCHIVHFAVHTDEETSTIALVGVHRRARKLPKTREVSYPTCAVHQFDVNRTHGQACDQHSPSFLHSTACNDFHQLKVVDINMGEKLSKGIKPIKPFRKKLLEVAERQDSSCNICNCCVHSCRPLGAGVTKVS